MAQLLVLKFGGTSLGSPERIRLAAARITAWRTRGVEAVVVVSASGRSTDQILAWLRQAAGVGGVGREAGQSEHSGGGRRPNAGTEEGRSRESDRALATGELLSAALMAAALGASGTPAVSLSGLEAGLRATGAWGEGNLSEFDDRPIRHAIEHGLVPVVAGFQAGLASGDTVTLGRGASDLTAVYLAAQLGADACHIITDVDGVFSADPRAHTRARRFESLTHPELVTLAASGARVVQTEAAIAARNFGVPLRIYHYKSALDGTAGTRVERSDRIDLGSSCGATSEEVPA